MPYLENVTRGRGIPRERLEAVSHHYLALGGVSPINEQNRQLVAALQVEFERRGIDLPIYWGNRNWDPYLKPELERIAADGHRRVIAFVTSAYSSYSGCRQYREDLGTALIDSGLDGQLGIDKIRHYFDHPGFVKPFTESLVSALRELATEGYAADETRVLFTTHSIPLSMTAASGPPGDFDQDGAYVAQHLAAIEAIVSAAGREIEVPRWSLVYQSRSGPPQVPWLEPDINDALAAQKDEGMRAAVVVPVGFVSDHVEVIWDLDTEARETCDELGLRMIRTPTPGVHPRFVSGIAELVEERDAGSTPLSLSPLGPWRSVCAIGCCVHPRGADLPTLAGEDSVTGMLRG